MKDTEFTYPSTDLFEEILQTERPVKEAANLLEEGYVKEAEETPRLKSWKIAVLPDAGIVLQSKKIRCYSRFREIITVFNLHGIYMVLELGYLFFNYDDLYGKTIIMNIW